MDSCQRREAALPWYIQDPEGSCSGQGTCFGLRRGDFAKSKEASRTQFRCCCVPPTYASSFACPILISVTPYAFVTGAKRAADASLSPAPLTLLLGENGTYVAPPPVTRNAPRSADSSSRERLAGHSSMAAFGVQSVLPLLPGQAIPQGVVAFGMALPLGSRSGADALGTAQGERPA